MNHRQSQRKMRARRTRRPRRGLWLLSAGVAVLVVVVAYLVWQNWPDSQAALEVTGAPSLRVDREKVNLGDVRLGQPVEVAFRLSNVGDLPLRFVQPPFVEVVSGC